MLQTTVHNPKSKRSSDVHLRAVARPILPSPRKPQVFPTKLSPRFRKRSFTWDTKKTVMSLLRPLGQWRMYTALWKFASSSFLIFYLSSPWVIATMKIVNSENFITFFSSQAPVRTSSLARPLSRARASPMLTWWKKKITRTYWGRCNMQTLTIQNVEYLFRLMIEKLKDEFEASNETIYTFFFAEYSG